MLESQTAVSSWSTFDLTNALTPHILLCGPLKFCLKYKIEVEPLFHKGICMLTDYVVMNIFWMNWRFFIWFYCRNTMPSKKVEPVCWTKFLYKSNSTINPLLYTLYKNSIIGLDV